MRRGECENFSAVDVHIRQYGVHMARLFVTLWYYFANAVLYCSVHLACGGRTLLCLAAGDPIFGSIIHDS